MARRDDENLSVIGRGAECTPTVMPGVDCPRNPRKRKRPAQAGRFAGNGREGYGAFASTG